MPYLTRESPDPEPLDCRILTAALELFVNNGYHNVSVHDVQKLANVSIGSIYNHFGGKEGIAKALYLHLLNEMNELVNSVLDNENSAISQCNRIIELLFEYTETRSTIIAFVLHAKHKEFLTDEPSICSAEPFTKMREIVNRGIKNGEIQPTNSWVAASSIFGGAIRLVHLRLDGVIEQPLPELYDQLVESIWQGMATASFTKPQKLTLLSK